MKISRRDLLVGAAASARAQPFPLAICSGTFAGMDFFAACKAARACGYQGIEIEPAHLDPDPASLSAAARGRIREAIRRQGLAFVGLHSLLKAPPGLHLTTAEAVRRRKSWEYLGRLIELAADLGPGSLMVLGSGKQRAAEHGVTVADAVARLREGLAGLAPQAEKAGVWILLEPLAPHLCNVVNTLEEAVAVIRDVGSPALATILDTHNTAAEKDAPEQLVRRYLPHIRHVHLNEMDGRPPGAGDYPFDRLLRALRRHGYRGWISVEVFDFAPDGETVARSAYQYLRSVEAEL